MSHSNKKKTGSVRSRKDGDDGSKEGKSKKLEKPSLVADVVGVIAQFVEQTTAAQRNLMLVSHTWRDGVVFQNGCKPMVCVRFDWEALRKRQTKKLLVQKSTDTEEVVLELGKHAQQLKSVDSMDFSGTDIGAIGLSSLRAFCSVNFFQNLDTLYFGQCKQVDDHSIKCISDITTLKVLRLLGTSITDAGVEHLTKLSLAELTLSETGITDESLKTVGKMLSLERLYISCCQEITDTGIAFLKPLHNLTSLGLDQWRCEDPHLTDTSLLHVSEIPSIVKLDVSGNSNYTDDGFGYLKKLKKLVFLDVGETNITDAGIDHVCELQSIHSLGLRFCDSITGLALKKISSLPALRCLDLYNNLFSRGDFVQILHLQTLQQLDFSQHDPAAGTGLSVLQSLQSLMTLTVWAEEFTDLEFYCLSRLPSVSVLHVQHNKELTAFQLDCLQQMPSLKTLHLHNHSEKYILKGIQCDGAAEWQFDITQ